VPITHFHSRKIGLVETKTACRDWMQHQGLWRLGLQLRGDTGVPYRMERESSLEAAQLSCPAGLQKTARRPKTHCLVFRHCEMLQGCEGCGRWYSR
jgi:hypothetical protein